MITYHGRTTTQAKDTVLALMENDAYARFKNNVDEVDDMVKDFFKEIDVRFARASTYMHTPIRFMGIEWIHNTYLGGHKQP
jgi:hypothetical protein